MGGEVKAMADRNHCPWCPYAHPVATMVEMHKQVCLARPSDG